MNALRTFGGEVLGLFIEDRYFAAAVAAWLAVMGVAASYWHGPPLARGITLFAGLAAILISSVTLAARRT